MKYVIMAGGKATRWKNFNNTPKHLVEVNGETLLARIVRQLNERGEKDIIVTSYDPRYEIPGLTRYEPLSSNKAYNMFNYELLTEPMVFLYGDTYYLDDVFDKIIATDTESVLYFGTKSSIVAIKVVDYEYFKTLVDVVSTYPDNHVNGWATYQVANNLEYGCKDIKDNFVLFDEDIINMNSPEEYISLMKKYESGAK